jgi:hypothetical protein
MSAPATGLDGTLRHARRMHTRRDDVGATQTLRTAPLGDHWWQVDTGTKIRAELHSLSASRHLPLAKNCTELGKCPKAISGLQANTYADEPCMLIGQASRRADERQHIFISDHVFPCRNVLTRTSNMGLPRV